MNQFLHRYERLGEVFDPSVVRLRSSLRVNTLRISEEELVSRLKQKGVRLEKISFLDHGYYYESPEFSLASSVEYLLGYIFLQEVASQLPAQVLCAGLELSDVSLIVDMCAAPGAKTTHLAQLTHDDVNIVALDDQAPRVDVLKNNLQRMRLQSIMTFRKDARFADDLVKGADAVLLDAPCSGNFCVEPNFFEEKTLLTGIHGRAQLQKSLLKAARIILKTGGVLVYSTCSLEPEEDELLIDWFISSYPDMELVSTGLDVGDPGLMEVFDKKLHPSLALTRRFWPHKTGTEGFFIAKLKKV